jgi:hypothetical protein
VGDEDDRLSLVGEAAQDDEEMIGLLRRQHRGRLVENEDLGATVKHLDDLDALLQPDREILDDRVRRHGEPVIGGETGERLARPRGAAEKAVALGAEQQVLDHREAVDEHEMLMHHADAMGNRIGRATQVDDAARNADLALIGPKMAVEDVHQRRLAGAVLADQPADAAARDYEIDVAVRGGRAEAFADPAQLDRGRSRSVPAALAGERKGGGRRPHRNFPDEPCAPYFAM